MSVVTARSSQFGLALSMRAICFFEGLWAQFEQWAYCKREGEFRSNYTDRWRQARLEGRVTRTALAQALAQPPTASTDTPGDNMVDHDSTAIADAA
jgi:hypothetical protein